MHIAIFATLNRPLALEVVHEVIPWLMARGHHISVGPEVGKLVAYPQYRVPEDQVIQGADLVLSIGGDGTMLGAVRAAAPFGVPVLGINAGALGFLTELAREQTFEYLPRVLAGDYTIEARMMLTATLRRGSTTVTEFVGLNDAVVRQGATGRLIHLDVQVAGHTLGHFSADGLIVSTPTGSTAYNLSAGGAIIHPTASVISLVPICPHSLSFRPIIIPAADPIAIFCEGNAHSDEMMITVDGQPPTPVLPGDHIILTPAPQSGLLIKLGLASFYDRLREKLQWGGSRVE